MTKPIFVDGPWKGRNEEISPDYIQRGMPVEDSQPVQHTPGAPIPAMAPRPRQVLYHFHRFVLLGHIIWVGSIMPSLQTVAYEDMRWLFDVVASDRAKEAMQ